MITVQSGQFYAAIKAPKRTIDKFPDCISRVEWWGVSPPVGRLPVLPPHQGRSARSHPLWPRPAAGQPDRQLWAGGCLVTRGRPRSVSPRQDQQGEGGQRAGAATEALPHRWDGEMMILVDTLPLIEGYSISLVFLIGAVGIFIAFRSVKIWSTILE